MRFIYKGKFESYESLPVAELPDNAVIYDEPDTLEGIGKKATIYSFVSLALPAVFLAAASFIRGHMVIPADNIIIGIILSFAMIVPHEFIHGLCFPQNAEVFMYSAVKKGMFFVTSITPMSKTRFIILSLMPNLLFGFLPLVLWLASGNDWLFWFGTMSVTMGAGDYFNVHNTIKQVPKGADVVLSGIHTYWYI